MGHVVSGHGVETDPSKTDRRVERLSPVHRPTRVGTPEESGTTLKKEGDNVVVLVIWHSY